MPPKKQRKGKGKSKPIIELEEGEEIDTTSGSQGSQGSQGSLPNIPRQGSGSSFHQGQPQLPVQRRRVVMHGPSGPGAGGGPSAGGGSCRTGDDAWIRQEANRLRANAQQNARNLIQPPQHPGVSLAEFEAAKKRHIELLTKHMELLTIKRQLQTGIEESEDEQARENQRTKARAERESIRAQLNAPPTTMNTTDMYKLRSKRIDILKRLIDERLKRIKIYKTGAPINSRNRALVWGDPEKPVVLTKTILDTVTAGATPNNFFLHIDEFVEMLEAEVRDVTMNREAETPLLNWVRSFQGKVGEITVSDPADISNFKELKELDKQLKAVTLEIKTSCIDPELDKPPKSMFQRMHEKVVRALKRTTHMEVFTRESALLTHDMWNMYIDVYSFFGQDVGARIDTFDQMMQLTNKIESLFIAILESLILICGTISLMNGNYQMRYMEIIRAVQPLTDTILVATFSPLLGNIVGELLSESCTLASKTFTTGANLKSACIDHFNLLKENMHIVIDELFGRDTERRLFYEALELKGDLVSAFPVSKAELQRKARGEQKSAESMWDDSQDYRETMLASMGAFGSQESSYSVQELNTRKRKRRSSGAGGRSGRGGSRRTRKHR
jgi:hypothetical protein